jgi:DNA-dependent RNA polymerase auxiliary subunit epsilon
MLKTFSFNLTYERRETIEVEASTLAEARELVEAGEFEKENIVDVEDDFVELSEGEEVK